VSDSESYIIESIWNVHFNCVDDSDPPNPVSFYILVEIAIEHLKTQATKSGPSRERPREIQRKRIGSARDTVHRFAKAFSLWAWPSYVFARRSACSQDASIQVVRSLL
jgi:hypothetical protein